MFSPPAALHFTGIGGIGMSGLAAICQALGCRVTGSDLKISTAGERLLRLGILVSIGHAASNVPPEVRAVVVTSAVNDDNPEVAEARRRGLPVLRRGELLAELMRTRRGIAVGGSHGKTTTSSMLAAITLHAGLDPTVFVGALVGFLGGSNARLGQGDLFVAECDESDSSFLDLAPVWSVITNIDREHLDHFGTFEKAKAAFVSFANKAAWYGAVIACVDDPAVRELLPSIRRRIITYGTSESAGLRAVDVVTFASGSTFRLLWRGGSLGGFELRVLGAHNVLNAAAATAVALDLGVGPDQIRAALSGYSGSGRRMETKGVEGGVTVIDDYGHHPTEIRATLEALRLLAPRRLVALFQPHRYTRTQLLFDEFASAFGAADAVRVLDLYAASESPIPGVTAGALARRISAAGHPDCVHVGSMAQAVASVAAELRFGDLLVTLGAGSVTESGPMILEILRSKSPDA